MIEALRRGDRVELRGFGMFSAKLREARQGRYPKTGAVVAVGKKAVPYFKTRERRCASGLIGKPCRRTDSRPCLYPKKKETGPSMTAGPLPSLLQHLPLSYDRWRRWRRFALAVRRVLREGRDAEKSHRRCGQ